MTKYSIETRKRFIDLMVEEKLNMQQACDLLTLSTSSAYNHEVRCF